MTTMTQPNPAIQPSTAHILVVEDDAKIADMLINYLQAQGYTTSHCTDGLTVAAAVRNTHPDVVLLDVMLPGLNGVSACQAVRQFSSVPLIMITARVDEIDRLTGLDVGADDYICKPFSPREVVARIKALLRRSHITTQPSAASENHNTQPAQHNPLGSTANAAATPLTLCQQRQQALWHGQPLPLTSVEFRLLCVLHARPGEVFSRAQLLNHLHSDWRDVSDRVVDTHIKNLRRKLSENHVNGVVIQAVYGAGYRLELANNPSLGITAPK